MFKLRPYQTEALDAVLSDVCSSQDVCLQAATGAGKTIIFSAFIQRLREQYPSMHIGVLAHREQLVRQAHEKLLSVWPEGADQIGIACSSVSGQFDAEKPVIIGSPQTLINRINKLPALQLIIVDECHRLPPKNVKSQYNGIISALREKYDQMRMIGVTATPYRLNHGYIYGDKLTRGDNWFAKLSYSITIEKLQQEGFLCPLRAFAAADSTHLDHDLSAVKKTGGDYNVRQVSNVMSTEHHLLSAVNAVREYATDRQHIVVFACTIEHAESLRDTFANAGFTACVVHSEQKHDERQRNLDAFDQGKVQVICNVGVLTEGWDCTSVDCMVMCRPTLSPALFVQMVGRGLRLHADKEDCLLLDLSGNYLRHGDLDNPYITTGERGASKEKKTEEKDETVAAKECPKCKLLVKANTIQCPNCGQFLKPVNNGSMVLTEIKKPAKPKDAVFNAHIECVSIDEYISRAGNNIIRFNLYCVPDGSRDQILVHHYWDMEGISGSKRFKERSGLEWDRFSNGRPRPHSMREAMARMDEITLPKELTI
ncbi:MAG: DEAD/DEAH box helicase, partial [Desulfovibrio sp.]|nr:DEAD/DEAH box helicase [Desulfovibrio sp.]